MTTAQPTTTPRDRAAEAAFLTLAKSIADRAREIAARRRGRGR